MRKLKYIDIATRLESDIKNSYKPGDLFLSVSQLKEKYNISLDTINKALSILERKGLLVRIHGKGTFVSEQEPQKYYNILILNDFDINIVLQTNYTKEALDGIYDFVSNKNIKIAFNTTDNIIAQPNIIDEYDGIILLSLQGNPSNIIRVIRKSRKNAVSITHRIEDDLIYNIDTNTVEAMKDILKYLKEKGHRKIGFLVNGQNCKHYHDSVRSYMYKTYSKEIGLEARDEWIISSDMYLLEKNTLPEIKRLSKEDGPTAYIISSFEYIKSSFLDKFFSIKHPEAPRLSITGFDIPLELFFYSEKPTYIKQNFKELGNEAIKILLDVLEHRQTDKLHIVPHDYIKGTTVIEIR